MSLSKRLVEALFLVCLGAAMSVERPKDDDALQEFLIWQSKDVAAVEQRFRATMAAYPDGSSEQAQVATQVARTLGLQQRFDEGHALLDQLAPRLDALPPIVTVRYLLERGRLFNSGKQKDKARPLFEQAWDKARSIEADYLAVDAAHMVPFTVPPAEQLAWNLKAVAYAEASRQPRAKRWLASLYNNIGMAYQDMGQYEPALAYFEKQLAERRQQGHDGRVRVARWMVAHVHRLMGRHDKALAEQLALERDNAAAGEVDGYVFEELAELYLAHQQVDEARRYFGLAHAALSQDAFLQRDQAERLARMKQLAGQ